MLIVHLPLNFYSHWLLKTPDINKPLAVLDENMNGNRLKNERSLLKNVQDIAQHIGKKHSVKLET